MPRPADTILRDVRMWASRATGRSLSPPDWLTVNLTLRCNLQCVMCTTCYDSPELSTREVMDLIDQAAAWGVRVFNPLGGEPFVRADLEDILQHASRRDMHTTLTTNGTLIRRDRADRIARVPVEKLHVNVSLDGPEAIHDVVRGPGTWKRTIAGYRALREADEAAGNPRRKICANVILHRKNVEGFLDFVHTLGELGFDGVQVLHLFRSREDDTVGGLWFDAESLPLLERVVAALPAEPLVLNAADDLRLVPRYYREGLTPLEAPCWAGWKELYVNADGSVIMCDGKLDFLAGRFGSVREATLRELWTSPALRARREVVKTCRTPCIQNCYLRRDSDKLAPLLGELAGAAAARARAALPAPAAPVRRAAPLRPLPRPLTVELGDVPDDPDADALRRLFARSPVPYAALVADPARLPELRDRHYLDFGRGFLGVGTFATILAAIAEAGFRPGTLRLRWRGEPLLHPELERVLPLALAGADEVILETSGLLWRPALARPGLRVLARPALAGPLAAEAAARAVHHGLPLADGEFPDGPAISWEGRVTASRRDVRLARRVGDALKEPFAGIWARVEREAAAAAGA